MARIVVPREGDFSQDRVIITRVFVAAGERVDAGSRLFECTTDKATHEIESPVAGTVVRVTLREGDAFSIRELTERIDHLIKIEERH